jgi:hypothetical protein
LIQKGPQHRGADAARLFFRRAVFVSRFSELERLMSRSVACLARYRDAGHKRESQLRINGLKLPRMAARPHFHMTSLLTNIVRLGLDARFPCWPEGGQRPIHGLRLAACKSLKRKMLAQP